MAGVEVAVTEGIVFLMRRIEGAAAFVYFDVGGNQGIYRERLR